RIGVNIWIRGLAAAATVALVATLLTVSGVAETILTIFEPKQLVAVPITVTDLNGAASFGAYGTLTWPEQPRPYDVHDIHTAARVRRVRTARAAQARSPACRSSSSPRASRRWCSPMA